MEKLAGYVEHIIYRNADNGYTVLNLVNGEDEITCVGIFSAIAEGENIEATGDYTEHPTYGVQFKVESFEEKAPEDKEAIADRCEGADVAITYQNGEQVVSLNGENVNGLIRTDEVTRMSSAASAVPAVRARLLDLQRGLAARNNVLMDGRSRFCINCL